MKRGTGEVQLALKRIRRLDLEEFSALRTSMIYCAASHWLYRVFGGSLVAERRSVALELAMKAPGCNTHSTACPRFPGDPSKGRHIIPEPRDLRKKPGVGGAG